MSQKPLAYILLWFLFQLLVNCQSIAINPAHRFLHTATFINNKLYILYGSSEEIVNDFFYLDFSEPFNIQELTWELIPWEDLTDAHTVPSHNGAASVKGGADNNTLFLYGGESDEWDKQFALVYTYNPVTNSWNIPTISGIIDTTVRRKDLTGIIDDNGKMYLWGGMEVIKENVDGRDGNYFNDMLILDTINLNWGRGSLVGAPTARYNYGATLLPNNNIIYMGGYNGADLTLYQVYLYNTVYDIWSVKTTLGKIPSNRDGFSIILGLDGQRIIIFGGITTTAGLAPEDSLYELNLINFEWYIPKISGQIPKSRAYHKANVIGNYMVVSFGSGYLHTESDILLLDISNYNEYIWTNNFVPSNNTQSNSAPSATSVSSPQTHSDYPHSDNLLPAHESDKSPINMIGVLVGSLFAFILLLFGGFFLYKWNKIKQEKKNATQILEN
ncbi:hypothetical protein C1645_742536 [Glomus cerebriforme]|uniref:Galactose oxidase n=1 Tax=Glomus cerebriforme TaxID=658196 RepID=A0A397SMV7_9GLOM|nr:hypothetical protein C1645_742536 [Glomus cerebriforme]